MYNSDLDVKINNILNHVSKMDNSSTQGSTLRQQSKPPVPSHRFQTVSSDVEMSYLNISHDVLRVSSASREASPIEPTVKLF